MMAKPLNIKTPTKITLLKAVLFCENSETALKEVKKNWLSKGGSEHIFNNVLATSKIEKAPNKEA